MSIETDTELAINKLERYQGFFDKNGIILLCEAMAVLLRLTLNIYIQGKRRG